VLTQQETDWLENKLIHVRGMQFSLESLVVLISEYNAEFNLTHTEVMIVRERLKDLDEEDDLEHPILQDLKSQYKMAKAIIYGEEN